MLKVTSMEDGWKVEGMTTYGWISAVYDDEGKVVPDKTFCRGCHHEKGYQITPLEPSPEKDPEDPEYPKRDLKAMIKGGGAIVENRLGLRRVHKMQAGKRYQICRSCKHNVMGVCKHARGGKKACQCLIPELIWRSNESCEFWGES